MRTSFYLTFLLTSLVPAQAEFCAYYTKINSGEAFEEFSRTGPEADIVVRDIGPDHGRFVFWRGSSYTDAQIGRVLAELDRTGLRESTVVCLWGDHGWHLGEHGLWGKTTNFELDTRSPLIIAVPGQPTAGSRSQSLAEFVDVYPTLVELCNLPLPARLEGTSLVPVLRDPLQTVKTAAFNQFPRTMDGKQLMGYSMRTDRYRLTRWVQQDDDSKVHAVELYDHQTDPQENTNIANHPANAELVAHLSAHFDAARRGPAKKGNP